NLPRYIDSQRPEDRQDIEGHLKGGIPVADVEALKAYWDICPTLKTTLFQPNRPGYLDLAMEKTAIKPTIYGHPEFAAFIRGMTTHYDIWRVKASKTLKALKVGLHPKEVIAAFSEDLLAHYADKPLIDKYDVYQHLMDYWAETLQDDCYLIAADGWKAATYRVIEVKKNKEGKITKEVDKGWACDLVPKILIVAHYYVKEQAALDQLAANLEAVSAKLAEMEDEHGGEDGALSEFDKINKVNVAARLKEIKHDPDAQDEATVLNEWLKLNTEETDLKKRLKEAESNLDAQAYAHYPQLTESEIKRLVVDDKWLTALDRAIHGEMDRISQALTQRVRILAERYETPLPQMVRRVADLEDKVNRHLERMGFAWK
ncbi:MAG: type I restriction endonuclease subunit M, partial [Thermoplasmataceae archaeon]